MPAKTTNRLTYIDWLRGLACLLMFQTHCYDSWLGGAAREGKFIQWSQLLGTLPAPLFLFLSGVSVALVTDKLRQKGVAANEIARKTILRGGQIFLLAMLFRLQEFLLGLKYAPWTDLLRVDVLNVIGLSLIMLGLACRIAATGTHDVGRLRGASIFMSIFCATVVALLTPPLWTTWQPHWRLWWLESYINGVHTFGTPQPWLFPLFPWSAFAFAGLAVGFLLQYDWARQNDGKAVGLASLGGGALIALGLWLNSLPVHLYAVYDFWHTSPNFFLIRVGVVMLTLLVSYVWCRWGAGNWGFSPLLELGKSSLLVYWVHIEFVYGGLSIVPKRAVGIGTATLGLLGIFATMTLLAAVHNRFHDLRPEIRAFVRGLART